MTTMIALSAVLAALLCAALVAALVRVMHRWGVVDTASSRSSHIGTVPRGGGFGVLLAVTPTSGVVMLSSADAWSPHGWALLGYGVTLGALGLVDDVARLPVVPRLVCQVVASGMYVGWLLQDTDRSWPATVGLFLAGTICAAGFVNAFNFMDGINAISGLTGLLAGSWYVVVSVGLDDPSLGVVGAALAGASLGFVPFNAPRARIFLGDVGSYFMGAILGGAAVLCIAAGAGVLVSVAPLLLYVVDTGWTLLQRLRRGESWRTAHRDHVYQRLVHSCGLGHLAAATLVALGTASMCAAALLAPTEAVALTTCAVIAVVYLASPRLLSALTAVPPR